MRERNDYVVPYFNSQYRFDKPPLTYWAQIASYHVLGENDFAARLPTALAAALIAVVILLWGRGIAEERVALWAAVIFTLCFQSFVHGKAAVAEMWLVVFMTIAHWAGWQLLRTQRFALRWWLTFYIALALAFLAKGPIGWTPLLTLAICSRGRRPRLIDALGIVIMLGLVALWGIPALLRTRGEFFHVGIGKHVIARSFGAMEGHGSNSPAGYVALLPFYFVTVFVSLFPWSMKLPSLARRLWHGRDRTDDYLVAGALIVFLIFTFVKTKLIHYTLPAFPLLALLMARHCAGAAAGFSRGSVASLPPKQAEATARFFRLAAISMAAACVVTSLIIFPIVSRQFPSAQLFKQAERNVGPEMEIGAVDYTEPSLIWYFRSRTERWLTKLDPATVRIFMEARGPRCVVLPSSLGQKLYPELPENWKRYTTSGINFVHGTRVQLTLLLKPW